ncbi:hypothetical protein M569_14325, partial [Genlisea aurea]
ETTIPHQKTFTGVTFPAVLTPTNGRENTPSDFVDAILEEKQFIESVLQKHGAVLFRGFGSLKTPQDFNGVVEAFGYEELPYVGGAAPRNIVYGRVYNTNDAPPLEKIPFHHEMAQVSKYPSKLFFFCHVPPAEGGETPIVLSHVVHDRMKKKHPDFVDDLEKLGLKYIRVILEEDDTSSPIGRGWKSTFLTDDKKVAEQKAANVNTKLEWRDDDSVVTIMGPIPAIKYDEKRRRKIWFNSMVSAYTGWADKRNDPTKAVTFGDGTPLPATAVYDCLKILEEESVAIPWEKGDVLLVDNLAALHSRKPYTPPRRILASLC